MTSLFLPHHRLQDLIDVLRDAGYECIGPTVRDGAIVYEAIEKSSSLPWGIRDHQSPGKYRLEHTSEPTAFGFANGPQGIKPWLFKPQETVWTVTRDARGKLAFKAVDAPEKPRAILGAKACDITAMRIQDKVFLESAHPDPHYQKRREALLIIGVQCTWSTETCFCVSAGTGPEIRDPTDIRLTEIEGGFVTEAHSERGRNILEILGLPESTPESREHAQESVRIAGEKQTRQIPLRNGPGLRDALFSALDHPRWESVAERCLSCGNCTSVCPTCFCHSTHESPTPDNRGSAHIRTWESCFSASHSELGGKVLRDTTAKRYRQWLTHKVGSWFDQFETSGCTGCGRCITWCPTGIDITEELDAIICKPEGEASCTY